MYTIIIISKLFSILVHKLNSYRYYCRLRARTIPNYSSSLIIGYKEPYNIYIIMYIYSVRVSIPIHNYYISGYKYI